MNILDNIYEQISSIGQCGLAKNSRDINDWVRLLKTPQGIEFCEEHKFPSLDIFIKLDKEYNLSQYGIYVNKKNIILSNKDFVLLVGNTNAELYYNTPDTHKVILMHEAKANIMAEKWGLVFVRGNGCYITKKDNARIL